MDTFKIKIYNFVIHDPSYFEEIKSSGFHTSSGYKHIHTNNAYRKKIQDQGIYIPKYCYSDVGFGQPDKALVLEFSASKLIYGTNLKSVHESDLPLVVDKLQDFLKSIKVDVLRYQIENSSVLLVAYAKNVFVGHLGSAQEIIRIIAPFDYRPNSEFSAVLMRQNRGISELKYFNKSSHLVIYDKLAEIQSTARTEEEQAVSTYIKTRGGKQLHESWVKETLRFEYTLHTKMMVNQTLSKFYSKKKDFTLREAFSDKITETLLRQQVDKIINHPLQKIVLLTFLDSEACKIIIDRHCKTLSQRRETQVAFDIISRRGLSAYREDILKRAGERTWFRKQALLKKISDEMKFSQIPESIDQLDNLEVLEYLLSQFGIESKLHEQKQLNLFNRE